ncbi:hypothetical protein Taro_023641 [Colocasia esculenta]|uniref:Uncharacterized protein n=1 Tax=Colocasia esculenta TaxID=4460 RepID=A0A843V584_COLES|nr:hypothetical protein [Colocasia esculenta]
MTLIHDALDTVPYGHVDWTPYAGEDAAALSWVEQGRPYFGREIWLHAFNTVVPPPPPAGRADLGTSPGGSGVPDSVEIVGEARSELPWHPGRAVTSEATSDEDYFRAYARRYGAQFDPEGRIASLKGILHSTIQQRDDLQRTMTQLRDELDRAQ